MRLLGTVRSSLLALLLPATVLLLAGCGTPQPTSLDLNGRVTDTYGVGVPNISVVPLGHAPTVTAADGSFAFVDVGRPYDLVAFDGPDGWAHLFLGLTEPQPRVVPGEAVFGGSIMDGSGATIHVTPTVSPGVNQMLIVCVENPAIAMSDCEDATDTDPVTVPVEAGWFGPGSVTATVRGVLYTRGSDDLPIAATHMGTASVTVSDSAVESLGLTMNEITDVDVPVQVSVPAGLTLEGVGVVVLLPGGLNAIRVPFGSPAGPAATVAIPAIDGASVVAMAQASDASGGRSTAWSAPVPATGATALVTLKPVPAMLTPADAAVGVGLGDRFAVEDRPEFAYMFAVDPDTGGIGPFLAVTSLDAAIDLPDLTALSSDFAIPAAQPYEWRVFAFGPFGTPNDLVHGAGPSAGYVRLMTAGSMGFGSGPAAAGWMLQTPQRTFTTP